MYGRKVKLRFFFVILILLSLILSAFLVLKSLEENVVYFKSPSDVKLTKELENHRFLLLEKEQQSNQPFYKELSATEEKAAITFLKKPNLLKRTNELIGKSGVIGEENNRQTMYLIFTSRKTNNPLHRQIENLAI